MVDDTVTTESPETPAATTGFERVAGNGPSPEDDAVDSESGGFALQQAATEKNRQDSERTAAGFNRKAGNGKGENGFTLSGGDAAGNGFTLPAADTGGLFGRKWSAFQPQWYASDAHAAHYARPLNMRLDRIIKRALENNWSIIGMEMGLAARIPGDPVLVRALNNRIQQMAAGGKGIDKYIRAIGYEPDTVRDQLRGMKAYSGNIKDIQEALRPAAPPPGAVPPGGSPPGAQPPPQPT